MGTTSAGNVCTILSTYLLYFPHVLYIHYVNKLSHQDVSDACTFSFLPSRQSTVHDFPTLIVPKDMPTPATFRLACHAVRILIVVSVALDPTSGDTGHAGSSTVLGGSWPSHRVSL